MRILKTAVIALFISTAFVACSKDDKPSNSFSMEGVWDGKIGQNSEAPSGQYKLNIKSGGTIERISSNGSVSASGSWNVSGNTFTAIYFYTNGTVVDVTGTVDKTQKKITAEWSNNGSEEGTLYVIKQ